MFEVCGASARPARRALRRRSVLVNLGDSACVVMKAV
jgi:hypothetical protein